MATRLQKRNRTLVFTTSFECGCVKDDLFRPWPLARLGGDSGDGHGEHTPHELPGMGQKPANPTMTNATPSQSNSLRLQFSAARRPVRPR